MLTDIERWNNKYAKAGTPEPPAPDPVLKELSSHFTGRGWAMDVACGRGANTGFLADRGYEALGIDCASEALKQADHYFSEGSTHWLAADFDQFFFPESFFSAVIVVRYLDRKLTGALVNSLVPGGLLFHRTFNVNHLNTAPGFNPRFVLSRGELVDLYDDLEVIDTNDDTNNTQPLSFILAQRQALVS